MAMAVEYEEVVLDDTQIEIDLTKDSPIPSASQPRRTIAINGPVRHIRAGRSRPYAQRYMSSSEILSYLTNNPNNLTIENIEETLSVDIILHRARREYLESSNQVTEIDDSTSSEEDNKHYTVESDAGEPTPLTCPICLESLCSSRKPVATRCGHIFCGKCLSACIKASKKCPTCKSTVKSSRSFIRLYF